MPALIENKKLREKMGEKDHKKVKERFTLDGYVDGVMQVIDKSANGKGL